MEEKIFTTEKGNIHFFTHSAPTNTDTALVFLPGITASHLLFEKQIAYFSEKIRIIAWDAPGHAASQPFDLNFDLMDKAQWLHDLLVQEGVKRPILVGQSIGGCVAQCYCQLFPNSPYGCITIDAVPLPKKYVNNLIIFFMKHGGGMFKKMSWNKLIDRRCKGLSNTAYGQNLMRSIMMEYNDQVDHYTDLLASGYKMMSKAYAANLPYTITCPALFICGDKDTAGFTMKYNRQWHQNTGIPLAMIPGAGHNANTDDPQKVNQLIEQFIASLPQK